MSRLTKSKALNKSRNKVPTISFYLQLRFSHLEFLEEQFAVIDVCEIQSVCYRVNYWFQYILFFSLTCFSKISEITGRIEIGL